VTVVKICGVRTLEDAVAAVDAGADMLGLNFYAPSPRYIAADACATLVAELRAARSCMPKLVGVFVNERPDEILRILDTCQLDYAQLSGDEPEANLEMLNGRAFKAVRAGNLAIARRLAQCYGTTGAPALLVDASSKGLYGGSGAVADWGVAAALAETMPLVLAGGLNPENVADAVHAVHPWGVDVASGVESAPGVKDAAKMKLFVERAKDPVGPRRAGS
jgi:phosphoribosylanthranilate isomerase